MPRDLKVSGPNLKDVQIYEITISSLDISGMRLENLKVKPVLTRSTRELVG